MDEQNKNIAQQLKKRITAGGKSKIYFVNNFSNLQKLIGIEDIKKKNVKVF